MDDWAELDHCLQEVLAAVRECPRGQSEYALLKRLQARRAPGFDRLVLDEPLSLYRTHFLLFHCLYRLQQRLLQTTGEWLRIHCLRIALEPPAGDGSLARAVEASDPLRTFYLDLANLDGVDAVQVEALLSSFWRRLDGTDDRRRQALAVLGLADPVDWETIRRRYRRLAQRHHPDRGGETAAFQRLQEAMLILSGGGR